MMMSKKQLVYLDRISRSNNENVIRSGLNFVQFDQAVTPDTKIFIKPNLTYPTYKPGVMTNPKAIEAAILAIKDYTNHIYIGDSDSGGYNRFSMDRVYQETGILDFAKKFGVKIINLSNASRKAIHFQINEKTFLLNLPGLLLDETDFLITMPVPKVHCNTGVSLSFKNQWGCIPEPDDRLKLHPYFKHVILEVNKAVKTRFTIMDGLYGLNRNGPMLGDPIVLDWLLIASDPGSAAQIGCDLMQIPLHSIRHLEYAKKMKLIPNQNDITINQEVRSFQKDRFFLNRKWTDLPGYIAFHSTIIAYLAYFSPIAGFLHKILYLFRKPLYDYDEYSKK